MKPSSPQPHNITYRTLNSQATNATSNNSTFLGNRFTYDDAKEVIKLANKHKANTKFVEQVVHNPKNHGNSFGKDLESNYWTINLDILMGIKPHIADRIRLVASVVVLVGELKKIVDVDTCTIKNLESLINKLPRFGLFHADSDLRNISIAAGVLLESHLASINNNHNIPPLTFYHFTLTKDIGTSKVTVELPFESNKIATKPTYFHRQNIRNTTTSTQSPESTRINTISSTLQSTAEVVTADDTEADTNFYTQTLAKEYPAECNGMRQPNILFMSGVINYKLTKLTFNKIDNVLTTQLSRFISEYNYSDVRGGGIEIRFKITYPKEAEQTDEIYCLVRENWNEKFGYDPRTLLTVIGGSLGNDLKDKNFSDLLVNAAQEKLNMQLCDQDEDSKQIILQYINFEDNDTPQITSTTEGKSSNESKGYNYLTLVKTIEVSPEQFKHIYTLLHGKYNLKLMLLQEIREITSNPTSEQRILNSVHVIGCAEAEKNLNNKGY